MVETWRIAARSSGLMRLGTGPPVAPTGRYLDYIAILAQSFLEYFSASHSRKKATEGREADVYEKVRTIDVSVQDVSRRLKRIEEKLTGQLTN